METFQLSAGNLSYTCGFCIAPFQPTGPHPGALNDELGFAFMASLCLLLVSSVCFALALVPFHLPFDIAVFGFRRSTVLRAQAFQQDNGEPKAAIARFGAPAVGGRWREPFLGVGLLGHRAPVWTP